MRLLIITFAFACLLCIRLHAQPSLALSSDSGAPTAEFTPPVDGGLGSTMTLEQLQIRSKTEAREQDAVLRMAPAAEPQPALRIRLWKPDFELRPGSAQLHFYRALSHFNQLPAELRNEIESWENGYEGVDERPSDAEVAKALERVSTLYRELEEFASCEDRTWDHRFRDLRGPEYFSYLLPDVQESRGLARFLRVKARYEIDHGRFDEAIATLQVGFRLAHFVGQGDMLVQQLVGIAMHGIMLYEVEHLMQADGSPNMYWALATLPRPFVHVRNSIEFELSSIYRTFPIFEEAEESQNNDPTYWARAWGQTVRELVEHAGVEDAGQQIAFTALGVTAVRPARDALIAAGMDREAVQAMAPMRAVLLAGSHDIRMMSSELLKANLLPDGIGESIASQGEQKFQQWLRAKMFTSAGAAVMGMLVPAVQAAKSAGIRSQYMVDRLMTIEAIRMHVAVHGSLPRTLAEMDQVPALPSPYTNQDFDYQQSSNGKLGFTLTSDVPSIAEFLRRVRVELRP